MRLKQLLFLLLFLLFKQPFALAETTASNQYYYDFNALCEEAYQAYLSLQIKKGDSLMNVESSKNPNNLIVPILQNYGDCLPLLYDGSPSLYKKTKGNMSDRLKLLEKGDPKSPWFLYSKASIYFQWALVKMRFNEQFAGATDLRKSLLSLKENTKKHPNFDNNNVLLGIEEAFAGTIPDNYKWLARLLGIKGDVKMGLQKIQNFLNKNPESQTFLRTEAIIYYSFMKFYLLSDKEETWRFLTHEKTDVVNNHSLTFIMANIAMDNNKADYCITLLQNRNKSKDYYTTRIFDLQMANVLLQKLDADAVTYYKKFLDKNDGRIYIKAAYQKLSYYYLTQGNRNLAQKYKEAILKNGTSDIDADKQAQRYAQSASFPHPELLKTQLYSAGGYFSQALNTIQAISVRNLSDLEELTEYYYRYGQLKKLMGSSKESINFYIAAINLGNNLKGQYAARAALELAWVYEDANNKNKAIEYYKKCLSFKNHDFQSSIDQKAKAGLNRLAH